MTKISSEFKEFNAAMDTILKADPAKVKAEMEADKKQRASARNERTKEPNKSSLKGSQKAWNQVTEAFKKNPKLQVPY